MGNPFATAALYFDWVKKGQSIFEAPVLLAAISASPSSGHALRPSRWLRGRPSRSLLPSRTGQVPPATFRRMSDLWDYRAELVPEEYQWIALCLLKQPSYWRDFDNIRDDMELEGHKDTFIDSNLAMLRAHSSVVGTWSEITTQCRDAMLISVASRLFPSPSNGM